MSSQLHTPRVQQLIDQLQLQSHPEGGWYRETYRTVMDQDGDRASSTAIYFLLSQSQHSRFHRIDVDEGWHHYEGDPIRIHILDGSGYRWVDLGPLNDAGRAPQVFVPAGAWFAAEVCVAEQGFALVGCTVAPGFDFAHFELAVAEDLTASHPEHTALINRLCQISRS